MTIAAMSPTQLMIWILLFEILSVPIIAFLASWVINLLYSKKSEFVGMIFSKITKTNEDNENEDEEKEDEE